MLRRQHWTCGSQKRGLCDMSYGWKGRLDHVQDGNDGEHSPHRQYVRETTMIVIYGWKD